MGNLPARVLTAAVLGGFVVFGILRLPLAFMLGFVALVMGLAAWEWARLAHLERPVARLGYAVATLLAGAATLFVTRERAQGTLALLGVAGAWWMAAAAWIVSYQAAERPRVAAPALLAACGWLALIPAGAALAWLLEHDRRLLLLVLCLIWSADTLAFFGGRRFGRRKLASHVSPGKTWEGFACALVGTPPLVLAGAAGAGLALPRGAAPLLVVAVLASVVGDLLESLLKRLRGIKDSGTLLPGHGGVLDRIDSVLAAVPVFTLGLIFLEQP